MSDLDDDSHEKEIDTLRALRASLESIKQVIQGVQDDLVVSQNNYKEITALQEKWTGVVEQVGQAKGRQ